MQGIGGPAPPPPRYTPVMGRHTRLLTLLVLSALPLACTPAKESDPHWDRARELKLQAEILAGNAAPDYAEETWGEVLKELEQVDPAFRRAEDASRMREEIGRKREEALAGRGASEQVRAREEEERKGRLETTIQELETKDPFGKPELTEEGRYQLLLSGAGSERAGGRFTVRGTLQNIGLRPLTNVLVLVDFLDDRDRPVRISQGMVDPPNLPPSATGSFRVGTQADAGVKSYRLRFRELSGSELAFRTPPPRPPQQP